MGALNRRRCLIQIAVFITHRINVTIEEPYCVLSNPAQTPDPELQLHNTGDLGSGLGSNRHMAPAWPGWKCDKEFTEARTRAMLVDSLHWRVFLAFQNNTFPAPALALAPALGTACEVVRRYGACTESGHQQLVYTLVLFRLCFILKSEG